MLMTNGAMKVTKWDELVVQGIDLTGKEFQTAAERDERGDAFFRLHGTDWYAKEFLTETIRPIRNMLDLSTGHVSKETIQFLDEQADSEGETSFIVYKKIPWGFFFPVFPEERPDLPEDLQRLLNYANDHSCTWIMLDADGEIVDELPFADWE